MTEAAAELLGEHGTPASDAVVYAMTHRVPVEAETLCRAVEATDGEVLIKCQAEGWHYLINTEGERATVCRASKCAGTGHARDSPYVRSLLETYETILVAAHNYESADV
jgi:hypothetical protein